MTLVALSQIGLTLQQGVFTGGELVSDADIGLSRHEKRRVEIHVDLRVVKVALTCKGAWHLVIVVQNLYLSVSWRCFSITWPLRHSDIRQVDWLVCVLTFLLQLSYSYVFRVARCQHLNRLVWWKEVWPFQGVPLMFSINRSVPCRIETLSYNAPASSILFRPLVRLLEHIFNINCLVCFRHASGALSMVQLQLQWAAQWTLLLHLFIFILNW